MLGIVVSRADAASVEIGRQLRALADWTAHQDSDRPDADGGGTVYRLNGIELREFDGLHVDLEQPARAFGELRLLVFVSRHSGDTGPLLTAHHPGNIGPAEYGGAPNKVPRAAPKALSDILESFRSLAPAGYEVGLECTHHGPTAVGAPALFVEVGSGEPQWSDPDAAAAAARAVLRFRDTEPWVERSFVGIGGGHYAPRFDRIVRETDWHVGHIAADWGLRAAGTVPDALLGELFERSRADLAVIEGDHPELVDRIRDHGYRVVSESWLRETDGVPQKTVERFEAALKPVADGLRFGRPARSVDERTAVEILEPAPDLLAAVNGTDAVRVRDAYRHSAVAFETAESGNRVTGRVAVAGRSDWEGIEGAFIELLRERFADVAVTDAEIVVTEQAFDPDRAKELGVEPGPAFGRLAEGEPVTVGSGEVRPEAVHETRTRRYPRC
ncbi:MAG: D-aminoacyl-tRNA deacylase [Halobacteriales archaeon]